MIEKGRLDAYRKIGDPLADGVIATYFPLRKLELNAVLDQLQTNNDQLPADTEKAFRDLHNDVLRPINSSNNSVIEDGQAFFSKHASDIMLMLGFLSLPYCYAAAKGAEVLARSNRIMAEPGKRLLETAEFVFDVSQPKAFAPEGKAFISILKVRLMHAAARWYVQNTGDWDDASLGTPVNQEDMAGTNLSFSLITVRGLRKLGVVVLPDQSHDYIQFWNFIGDRLGLLPELLPETNKEAYLLEKWIKNRQFEASDSGKKLTKALMDYFETATKDSPIEGKSQAFVQYLLGDQISSLLGLKVDNFNRLSFRPFKELMKLKNVLLKKEDNYLNAFREFNQRKKALD